MTRDWLLVETLGTEPAVVAQGQHTRNFVPVSALLRRNPNLMAIQAAIGETVHAGKSLTSLTPKSNRVIRTELVRMTDGRIHGVHVWIGPLDSDPPERPSPGPFKWDLTNGIATDTTESLRNGGLDPTVESTEGRAFAEDFPARALNPSEATLLSMAIKPEVGRTFCATWDAIDFEGTAITVGFVTRVLTEADDDGHERLICRAMNWRSVRDGSVARPEDLGERILNGLAEPGVHRALVDFTTWKLLKWLDDPCPFYAWRASAPGQPTVHPDDAAEILALAEVFDGGPVARVLRLRANDGGWTPIHVTVHRVELEPNTYAGLLSLRKPTDAELAPRGVIRRARARVEKSSRA